MMMLHRKRFFSNESCSELPICNSSSALHSGYTSCCSGSEGSAPSSPPTSGNGIRNYVIDFSRIIPGRASSTTAVRQRSTSLSPKTAPRKSISMFMASSHSVDSSLDCNNQHTCNVNNHSHNNNHTAYGMLNPGGPLVRKSSFRSFGSNVICSIVAVMGLVVLAVLAASSYQHNATLVMELTYKETEIDMHLHHTHTLERQVSQMRKEEMQLRSRIQQLELVATQPTQEELGIQRKIFHLEHYQEQVHRGIEESSKRMLRETYGPGPKYYIEIRLAFHPDSNIVQDSTTEIDPVIVLETAAIDDMPHTVHFFLEQVRHGIFDNTAFYRNAPNFVQAGPGHDHVKVLALEQQEPSLAHVLFQEHSHELNHKQYTLGLIGRPGGPDFYVNMEDNSEVHGFANFAIQRNDVMVEADPCFARIVRGFNTIERIHRADVKEEEVSFRRNQNFMVHQVMIESMRVLSDYNDEATSTTEITAASER